METIGTSLKTIFAKFQQVKKDTGEVNKDFSATINTLEKMGVETGSMAGQLKPVGEILQELANKWNDMNDKQKAMVSSSLGVYQISRFSALMQGLAKDVNGVSRSQQIYSEVMKASGETNKQYETYLNSLSGAIDKFKAQWEVVFNNSMNSSTLKSIVNIGTGILNLVDKFGGLNIALVSLGTALLSSNNKFKAFKNSFISIKSEGKGFAQTLMLGGKSLQELKLAFTSASAGGGVFKGTLNMLKTGLTGLKLKAIGAKIAVEGLKMALTLGLSVAITFALEGIMKLINKSSELKQKNQELQQSVQQNIKSNNDMITYLRTEGKEYDNLSKKTKLTTEEQEKLKSIKQQLVDKFPELVKGINSETGEMELQKKSTKELIELLKQKNKLESNKLISGGNDFLKDKQKEYREIQKTIDDLKHQAKNLKNGGDNVGLGSNTYKHTIDGLNEIKRTIGLTKTQQEELDRKTEEYKNILTQVGTKVEQQKQKYSELKPYVQAVFDSKNLDSFQQKLANVKIDPSKFVKDGNLDFTGLQVEIQQFKDKIENDPNYSNIKMVAQLKDPKQEDLKKYFDSILSLSKTLKMSPLELTKIMPLSVDKEYLKKNSDLFVKILKDEIKKASGQNKIDLTNMIKMFDGSELAKEGGKVAVALENVAQKQETATKAYQGAISSAKDYNRYLQEMREHHHLSAESIAEIIEKHEDLIPLLGDEKGMYHALESATKRERDVAINAITTKLEGNIQFCSRVVSGHQSAFNDIAQTYNVDLSNFETVATAKSKINAILCSRLKSDWLDTYGNIGNAMKTIKGNMTRSFLDYKGGDNDGSDYLAMKNDYMQLEGLTKGVDIIEKSINEAKNKISKTSLNPIDFRGMGARVGGGHSGGSGRHKSNKGQSGSKSKYHTDNTKYKFTGQALNEIDGIIKTINNSIEQTDKNITNITQKIANLQSVESKSNYAQIIDEENTKLDQQRIKVKKLQSAQSQANEKSKAIQKEIWTRWSWMEGKDLSKLSSVQWDKLYNEHYGKEIDFGGGDKAKKWKEAYDKGAKMFQEMRKDYENTRELSEKSAQDELKMEQEINATIKERIEIQKASYDEQLKLEQKQIDLAQVNLDVFNIYEKENVDYIKKAQLTGKLIAQQKSYLVQMIGIRNEITRQRNALQENTLEWNLLNSLLDEYEGKINESNKNLQQTLETLEEIRKSQLNELSNMQDKIVNALKKQYEKELELAKEKKAKELLLAKNLNDEQLKLIKDGSKTALEIFEEEHQKKMDLLNEELKSYEEIYNAKIKDIDDKESEDKYSKELNKKQKEKSKLQIQHDALMMDSSLEAKAKRESLLEEIKKKQEDIDQFQHDRDITLRKKNLKEELDAKKKKIQSKIDAENKEYKEAKKRYDREVKALERANKEKLKKENLYAKAREMLMQNNFDTLKDFLIKYGEDSEKIFGVMGETIKKKICDNLKNAIDLMQHFNTLSDKKKWKKAVGYDEDYIMGDTEKPTEITHFGNIERGVYEWDNIYENKEYKELVEKFLEAQRNDDTKAEADLRKQAQELIGKYKKHKDGGLNTSTGFHWLDGTDTKPELVLNADQTQAMLDIKDYLPNISKFIQQPKINLPKINLPNNVDTFVKQPIEFKVDNLINIEGNVDKNVVPKIKHAGNDIITRMKQEMNKVGIYRRL
ncbi:hypothetical protein IRP62_11785 (plasmid) [Clostridium botulinum]|uniref:tail length tape measure protein n=1 Tax=Clostridium botulinum C phage TaxID=12336 RepID=UPI00005DB54A|nr:hypothetical protein [Clostridium botulinum]YP_398560.1 tail length tape measure protein [Clostridium phage c-st]QPW54282.1 hypothetical protein IRP62_11785 [Clostridium botulinum]BAE47828.1 conserved hypothetical phage-related protein [Clostridium phage c-st]